MVRDLEEDAHTSTLSTTVQGRHCKATAYLREQSTRMTFLCLQQFFFLFCVTAPRLSRPCPRGALSERDVEKALIDEATPDERERERVNRRRPLFPLEIWRQDEGGGESSLDLSPSAQFGASSLLLPPATAALAGIFRAPLSPHLCYTVG